MFGVWLSKCSRMHLAGTSLVEDRNRFPSNFNCFTNTFKLCLRDCVCKYSQFSLLSQMWVVDNMVFLLILAFAHNITDNYLQRLEYEDV